MRSESRPNFRNGSVTKTLAALLVIYALVLAALAGLRPFWLDEILQLVGTRDLSVPALLNYTRTFPGAAPLGYLAQHRAIGLFGFSPFSARLSSAVFSLASCVALGYLARSLDERNTWFSLLCWMALPLQLRYALEGRPYAQALFFSVLCTALFFRVLARPRFATGLYYLLALIGGVYSAPYTLFLQLGYVSWAVLARRWKASGFALSAFLLAAFAYLPWYSSAVRHWEAYEKVSFTFSPKFLLLPLKEITGGVRLLSSVSPASVGRISPGQC